MTKRYEVLTYTVTNGWDNCWSINGEPETFASVEEAEAAIKEFQMDIGDTYGVEAPPSREEFMIVEEGVRP